MPMMVTMMMMICGSLRLMVTMTLGTTWPNASNRSNRSSAQIENGGIDKIQNTHNDQCTREFFVNYKDIHVNYFKIYNDEFLEHVSTKNLKHIDLNEFRKYQEFIGFWNDFVLKVFRQCSF